MCIHCSLKSYKCILWDYCKLFPLVKIPFFLLSFPPWGPLGPPSLFLCLSGESVSSCLSRLMPLPPFQNLPSSAVPSWCFQLASDNLPRSSSSLLLLFLLSSLWGPSVSCFSSQLTFLEYTFLSFVPQGPHHCDPVHRAIFGFHPAYSNNHL